MEDLSGHIPQLVANRRRLLIAGWWKREIGMRAIHDLRKLLHLEIAEAEVERWYSS